MKITITIDDEVAIKAAGKIKGVLLLLEEISPSPKDQGFKDESEVVLGVLSDELTQAYQDQVPENRKDEIRSLMQKLQ